jgi:hypothetical protein
MLQMIFGLACLLAAILLGDNRPRPQQTQNKLDPWVILALEELDEEAG